MAKDEANQPSLTVRVSIGSGGTHSLSPDALNDMPFICYLKYPEEISPRRTLVNAWGSVKAAASAIAPLQGDLMRNIDRPQTPHLRCPNHLDSPNAKAICK